MDRWYHALPPCVRRVDARFPSMPDFGVSTPVLGRESVTKGVDRLGALTVEKTATIGAVVMGADPDRLVTDDALPGEIRGALEEHGVLVFPQLGLDEETQVAWCRRLGEVDFAVGLQDGIMRVSLDPAKSPRADYFRGNFSWHIDGCTLPPGRNPQAATVLTAVAVAEEGGQTEFANTYATYDDLSSKEKSRYGTLRVRHSVAAIERTVTPNPTAEQEAKWATGYIREHPLVWGHRSGRHSLVIGATADSVVGLDAETGRALLDDLLERSTNPDRVYRHNWSVGDTVIWSNRGLLHRVIRHAEDSPREMIRTSLLGDEPIE
jgi:alpha-ketoglutarate-dependent taurine dioxygenase